MLTSGTARITLLFVVMGAAALLTCLPASPASRLASGAKLVFAAFTAQGK